MSQSYTPGLKRKELCVVSKIRKLPSKGEVLVKKGDKVTYESIVARAMILGDLRTANVATDLQIEPYRTMDGYTLGLKRYLLKNIGDEVEKDELVALKKGAFGLKFLRRQFISPFKGTIEYISDTSGQMLIREPEVPLELDAYITGEVIDVLENEGVTIQTAATFVQGIFGIGGETHGELMSIVDSPNEVLTAGHLGKECKGKILLAGSNVEAAALHRAIEVGVLGLITGGMECKDLIEFMGYTIGVAITGHEEVGLTLIITEGFSTMEMSKKTFDILGKCEGKLACINGSTQIRAGVIRPEIIVPLPNVDVDSIVTFEETIKMGMKANTRIRLIREPYFGALGYIVNLPKHLQKLDTESKARVFTVKLDDGRQVIVPRANVELIE